jgi:hypothetical protein
MNNVQQRVQAALDQNPKNMKLGGEVFNVEPQSHEIKPGRPFVELISEFRKAAKEKIFVEKSSEAY